MIAQNENFDVKYNGIMNYVPTHNFFDSKTNLVLIKRFDLNSIASLSFFSYLTNTNQLPFDDKKWLEKRIQSLVKGLFFDNQKILISKIGGSSGCTGRMIDSISLNNIKIVDLKFCFSCTDYTRNDFFIKVFNKKMYELMKIKYPDYTTIKFHGEFTNKKKKSNFKKLILNEDRTFKLWKLELGQEVILKGIWENNHSILNLNLSENDTVKLLLKKEKLISLNDKKIKFIRDQD